MNPGQLITVSEARQIIAERTNSLHPVLLPIHKTSGLILAEDVSAPMDYPAFDQSSMDGYAIRAEDMAMALTVHGTIPAGSIDRFELLPGHTQRIFTGAPLPPGADTVIMQEKVKTENSLIRITDPTIEKGTHVRLRGADIKKGEQAVSKGVTLSPAVIGFMTGMGINSVSVYAPPSVTLLATGKELQQPGKMLRFGQVYESNTYFLSAALRQALIEDVEVQKADDVLSVVTGKLGLAISSSDMVLVTGGVSVGDYDFVRQAADANGVNCHFHGVKQRPGKPLYFGTREDTLVFGLPGNPASVISCFYEYVLPAIEQIMQRPPQFAPSVAFLKENFKKVPGLTQFLKGRVEEGMVSILSGQESFRLRPFSQANCLVCLDEERITYEKGEQVIIRPLPV